MMFFLKGHLRKSCHIKSDNDMQGWARSGKPRQYKTAESKRNIKIYKQCKPCNSLFSILLEYNVQQVKLFLIF